MNKTLTATAAFALTASVAGTAQAGDIYKKDGMMKTQATYQQQSQQNTQTVSTRTLDGALITSTPADQQYAVLGVVDRDGQKMYRIADETGQVFENFVPSEIVPVTTNIEEVDTFTYEYNSRTYTNRVVRDSADSVG